jgi:hypothetical protein
MADVTSYILHGRTVGGKIAMYVTRLKTIQKAQRVDIIYVG